MTYKNSNLYHFFSKGKILFLGCHLDDIEYGCGGLIRSLVDLSYKDEIIYLTLTNHNESSKGITTLDRDINEVIEATSHLGLDNNNIIIKDFPGQRLENYKQEIREVLIDIRSKYDPKYVFIPSKNDIHQDHQVLNEEGIRIFRNVNCFGYELIRSCYHFNPNFYYELNESIAESKIKSVISYKSQLTQSAGYYFNSEVVKSILTFRGGQSNMKLAEAYEIYFQYL